MLVGVCALLAPAEATAAAASARADADGVRTIGFFAGHGERNLLTVSTDRRGRVLFRDHRARVTAKDGCVRLGRHRARCPVPRGGDVPLLRVELGDRADRAELNGRVRAVINGASGNDRLVGGNGTADDQFDSGDVIHGGTGTDNIRGGDGADLVAGGSGRDLVIGGVGDDNLYGGSGRDTVEGRDGKDTLAGGDGNDRLDGDEGHDVADGNAGADFVEGDEGNDELYVGSDGEGDNLDPDSQGNDRLEGGAGRDLLDSMRAPGTPEFRYSVLDCGDGTDDARPSNGVQVAIERCERALLWDDRLVIAPPHPRLDRDAAVFTVFCGVEGGCRGELYAHNQAEESGAFETYNDFDIPQRDRPQEVRVTQNYGRANFTGAKRLRVRASSSDDPNLRANGYVVLDPYD